MKFLCDIIIGDFMLFFEKCQPVYKRRALVIQFKRGNFCASQ